jgi:hypothetical protein
VGGKPVNGAGSRLNFQVTAKLRVLILPTSLDFNRGHYGYSGKSAPGPLKRSGETPPVHLPTHTDREVRSSTSAQAGFYSTNRDDCRNGNIDVHFPKPAVQIRMIQMR